MRLSQPQYIGEKIPVSKVWKEGDWNSFRIRMVGEAPRVTTWVNGTQLYELQMPKNDQIGGIYGGMIGLQLHYTSTYTAATQSGGFSGAQHAALAAAALPQHRHQGDQVMRRHRRRSGVAGIASVAAPAAAGTTNSIGMEFVLIQPARSRSAGFSRCTPSRPTRTRRPTPAPAGRARRARRTAADRRGVRADRGGLAEGCDRRLPGDDRRAYYIGKYEVTQAQYRR